ncbi:MAG: PIN domain-containing protein [Thermodesulfobacteriota bacterium]|nr:PIN domain-containing protein [Thermodesulfobacteriota bacterium]
MTKEVFVDTSAFYALIDAKDPAHRAAKKYVVHCNYPMVTTEFIFAESLSLITKRLGKNVAIRFGEALRASRLIRMSHSSEELIDKAWEEFVKFSDKGFDLIDCISFVTMENLGINAALSFDKHFTQRGFDVVPSKRF